MNKRVALMSIIVEKQEAAQPLNALLSEYREFIIGRMGIPYHARGVNLISVVLDAPADAINSLSGKAGSLPGVTSKVLYSKLPENAVGTADL